MPSLLCVCAGSSGFARTVGYSRCAKSLSISQPWLISGDLVRGIWIRAGSSPPNRVSRNGLSSTSRKKKTKPSLARTCLSYASELFAASGFALISSVLDFICPWASIVSARDLPV
ncbi:hypothetical protein WKI68_13120 [Streptomyces sp. MS1.HAVA.3]|uniref:Secreted protein n=1 Tax=Streptomyces caledonius TaxID=3134107 RepID=A0ABU8U2R6_9ACTN